MKTTDKNLRNNIIDEFPGYPHYPDSEDIYSNEIEVKGFEPNDLDKMLRNLNDDDVITEKTLHHNDIVSRE